MWKGRWRRRGVNRGAIVLTGQRQIADDTNDPAWRSGAAQVQRFVQHAAIVVSTAVSPFIQLSRQSAGQTLAYQHHAFLVLHLLRAECFATSQGKPECCQILSVTAIAISWCRCGLIGVLAN